MRLIADTSLSGVMVWCKCPGFPWWPAVVDDTDSDQISFYGDNSMLERSTAKLKPFLAGGAFAKHATKTLLSKHDGRVAIAEAVVAAKEDGARDDEFGVDASLIAQLEKEVAEAAAASLIDEDDLYGSGEEETSPPPNKDTRPLTYLKVSDSYITVTFHAYPFHTILTRSYESPT